MVLHGQPSAPSKCNKNCARGPQRSKSVRSQPISNTSMSRGTSGLELNDAHDSPLGQVDARLRKDIWSQRCQLVEVLVVPLTITATQPNRSPHLMSFSPTLFLKTCQNTQGFTYDPLYDSHPSQGGSMVSSDHKRKDMRVTCDDTWRLHCFHLVLELEHDADNI